MTPEERLAAMLAAMGYDITPATLLEVAKRAGVLLTDSVGVATAGRVKQHIIWHNNLSSRYDP
jgi:hypothetical protein